MTVVEVDDTVQYQDSSVPGTLYWPCILDFDELRAGTSALISVPGASQVRAEATVSGYTQVTAELTLNPAISFSCDGPPNSLGLSTRLDFHGTSAAAGGNAAVRVSDLPAGVATVLIVTDAFAGTPLGAGPLPDLCLRGTRAFQEIKFSEGPGAVGEAVFDVDLSTFAPGESFAIQVGHREPGGGAGTSNMLVGTAG